jgi:hypothetical protein
MTALLIIGAVAGALLGLRFKILVLIPASLITTGAVTIADLARGYEFRLGALAILGTVVLLQIGYLFGCIVQAVIPAHQIRATKFLRRIRYGTERQIKILNT